MDYRETIDYLFSQLPMFQRIGDAAYKSDLNNTIQLCKLLGNPQDNFRSVHIAGTNGKGSIAHLLASILQEAGYKTGLFTSPHLKDFRERIRINGKKIGQQQVIDFVQDYRPRFETISPSFFEYTFGLAVSHFNDEKVDIALLETGMGGRLDSTNVVTPILSVITNIGLDHTQFLGDTIEKIALEKAGIIKENIPVVIGEKQKKTENVFREKAAHNHAEISFAEDRINAENITQIKSGKSGLSLDLQLDGKPWLSGLRCQLPGVYQSKNILTTLAVVLKLRVLGYQIYDDHIRKGMEQVIDNTNILGRWQILGEHPLIICDTGHNEDGLKEVVKNVRSTDFKKLHFILGMVGDKGRADLYQLLPKGAKYYFCKADIPRGLDAAQLRQEASKAGLNGLAYLSVSEALATALQNADEEDLVFAGGSTFIVAEVLNDLYPEN